MRPVFDPTRLRAALFDFDGTLAIPALDFDVMRRCARKAMSAYAPIPQEALVPVMEELAQVCASLDPEKAVKARRETMDAIKEVELEAARRSGLFPFVRPMLDCLRDRGIACAVITRNCPESLHIVFPDLEEHVACVLTRDDVANVKPHPEHIGKALGIIGCGAEESLMVGDHPMDIEAGRRAGTYTAGVVTGDSSREALEKAGPDWLADDAGQLMRMLGLMGP